MAEVVMTDVEKVYADGTRAVTELNLRIDDGHLLVIVGPSGCGKTTALRMVAGLEEISSGTIHIGGREVNRLDPGERDVAMVFQNYALYPHMTVYGNIAFPLRLARMPKAERDTKVRATAKVLGLESHLQRKPPQLSGGQRQRVAMGRAIVREPSVFLMDEPLSNLDAKLRVETRANIADLQHRLGTTTVYVTHDQVEAMTMGDRVAVLKDGILNQCDTPRNLYARPVNVFVAGFMGSPAMNLLTVPLVAEGAKLGDTVFPLPRELLAEASGMGLKEVTFGVRPENITLSDKGVPVTIDLVEELGADSFVHGHSPDGDRLVIRADARIHPSPGSVVHAMPTDADHCHIFDPTSGLRLKASRAVPADASLAAPSTIDLG